MSEFKSVQVFKPEWITLPGYVGMMKVSFAPPLRKIDGTEDIEYSLEPEEKVYPIHVLMTSKGSKSVVVEDDDMNLLIKKAHMWLEESVKWEAKYDMEVMKQSIYRGWFQRPLVRMAGRISDFLRGKRK